MPTTAAPAPADAPPTSGLVHVGRIVPGVVARLTGVCAWCAAPLPPDAGACPWCGTPEVVL